jgi:hypothetical protein
MLISFLKEKKLFDDQTQKEIYLDIMNFKEIYEYEVIPEIITDDIYNIRLRIYCKVVEKTIFTISL